MNRIWVLLLIVVSATASASVFRLIGPDGEVYFTDRPVAGAEPVDLVQTFQSPAAIEDSAPAELAAEIAPEVEQDIAPSYAQFTVVKPSHDQGVRANDGSVTIYLSLQPALMDGHTIVLNVDGEDGEKILSGESLNFNLSNMSRGRHTVSAKVINEQGEELISTGSVGFYVLRVALGGG